MLTKLMGKTILGTALAAMTCAGPAQAHPAEANANSNSNSNLEMVEATIKHDDLDLSSPSDLARLKLRVERKARAICSSRLDRELIDKQTLACRAQVISSAAAQIDRAVKVAALRRNARKG